MARSTHTVSQLAKEAGIDVDEVLIVLWDNGIGYVNGPTNAIRKRDRNKARRLVGLATRRQLASVDYWKQIFGLDDEEFGHLLESIGIPVPEVRRLSKKAVTRLRFEARKRGLYGAEIVALEDRGISKGNPGNTVSGAVPQPWEWKVVGQEREVRNLSVDDVEAIHNELVTEFLDSNDPISPPGVRDENLLGSAVSRPLTSIGEFRKYPSVEMAGAALLHSIIHNHAFHNGNKRTALVSVLAFLDLNGMLVTCGEQDLFKLVIRITQHSIVPVRSDNLPDREVMYIAEWIYKNSRRIELRDRNIPFRRLRKLLSRYDCTYSNSRGNQMNISRTILRKRWFGRRQPLTLSTQTSYGGEGRELNRISLAKIRKDLRLDEPNGIDSASFYDNAPAAADEFIIRYRKTLKRLASL